MRTKTFIKDPDSILDWDFNWNVRDDDEKVPWLRDDEIITDYEIIPEEGITVVEDTENDGHVIVWLGAVGSKKEYSVTCRITTNQKRTEDRTMLFKILER